MITKKIFTVAVIVVGFLVVSFLSKASAQYYEDMGGMGYSGEGESSGWMQTTGADVSSVPLSSYEYTSSASNEIAFSAPTAYETGADYGTTLGGYARMGNAMTQDTLQSFRNDYLGSDVSMAGSPTPSSEASFQRAAELAGHIAYASPAAPSATAAKEQMYQTTKTNYELYKGSGGGGEVSAPSTAYATSGGFIKLDNAMKQGALQSFRNDTQGDTSTASVSSAGTGSGASTGRIDYNHPSTYSGKDIAYDNQIAQLYRGQTQVILSNLSDTNPEEYKQKMSSFDAQIANVHQAKANWEQGTPSMQSDASRHAALASTYSGLAQEWQSVDLSSGYSSGTGGTGGGNGGDGSSRPFNLQLREEIKTPQNNFTDREADRPYEAETGGLPKLTYPSGGMKQAPIAAIPNTTSESTPTILDGIKKIPSDIAAMVKGLPGVVEHIRDKEQGFTKALGYAAIGTGALFTVGSAAIIGGSATGLLTSGGSVAAESVGAVAESVAVPSTGAAVAETIGVVSAPSVKSWAEMGLNIAQDVAKYVNDRLLFPR